MFVVILGSLLLILGFIGCFLPVLPGPIVSYLVLILIKVFYPTYISWQQILIFGFLVFLVTILDYILPGIGTKKLGGSKFGVRGANIGLFISVFVLPLLGITLGPFGLFGIILGPFLGAYLGEKFNKQTESPLKAAFGAFIGFLTGTFLKILLVVFISIPFLKFSYFMIKNFF